MTHQQVIEVAMDDLLSNEDLAKVEAESAKVAAGVAEKASTEAQGDDMPGDLRQEWARISRAAAGLAWMHAMRADAIAPGTSIARGAKEHVARAKGFARSAELACEI